MARSAPQGDNEKELGVSRSYVSRIQKQVFVKLYPEFYRAKRSYDGG
ncbi:hypothetical protein [Paenibacillus odorifer]|nr:hypothetical protein [Paenibacillus odorifer]